MALDLIQGVAGPSQARPVDVEDVQVDVRDHQGLIDLVEAVGELHQLVNDDAVGRLVPEEAIKGVLALPSGATEDGVEHYLVPRGADGPQLHLGCDRALLPPGLEEV